jgi:hypothetical protein
LLGLAGVLPRLKQLTGLKYLAGLDYFSFLKFQIG